jgi:hypothetical protein
MEDTEEKNKLKLLKQLYYHENKDRIISYNSNRYYINRYGKNRDEVRNEKAIIKKQKIELQLNKINKKIDLKK